MRNNRSFNEPRKLDLIPNFNRYAEGSCLIKLGNTQVICTASIEEIAEENDTGPLGKPQRDRSSGICCSAVYGCIVGIKIGIGVVAGRCIYIIIVIGIYVGIA